MKLAYFAMPVHPMERDWVQTLKEDREAVILADQLGYVDAFIGEHLTDKAETITNSLQFLATLIPETKRIKLGTGTANLSQAHPVLIANQAAMFDHLSEGRFNPRGERRRRAVGHRGARDPRRGPQQDLRRRDPCDLGG